jgi:cobalt-zinc-cadmium efflux system membrane fusion protein
MKKILFNLTLFVVSFFLLVGCAENKHEEEQKSKHSDHENESVLQLTQKQVEVTGIVLGKPALNHLRGMISCNGTLELPPQNKAAISSYLGGLVSRIFVIQGMEVKAGQVLAMMENPEYIKIQERYLQSWNQMHYVQKDFERQKILSEEKVVSDKKYQLAETDLQNQQAVLLSLESQIKMLGINPEDVKKGKLVSSVPIKTPIGGFIHTINIVIGAYVEPAKELFTVVDNHHVHIDLHVFERDAHKIKIGQTVLFGFSEKGDKPYQAEVFAVGKAYDESTRSIAIHAEIRKNNEPALLPGMFVHARIVTDTLQSQTLPEEAIVSMGDMKYIYALSDTTDKAMFTFKKYAVKTGIADNGYIDYTFIETPLFLDKLVLKGSYYLKAKELMDAQGDGGHGH